MKLENGGYNLLTKIIKNNHNVDIDKNVVFLKNLLTYVAKVCLIVSQMEGFSSRYDEIFDYMNSQNPSILPKVFFMLPEEFMDHSIIPDDDRKLIVDNISKLTKDEIAQISLGELFQSFITNKEKKYLGQVYTPKHIVKEMIDFTINVEDIISNPYFKIIDPACGGGYFLLEAYDKLREIFETNYDDIVLDRPKLQQELDKGLHSFIIENNLWGTDIDEFAVFMTSISLYMKDCHGGNPICNIYKKDILLDGRDDLFTLIDNMSSYDMILNEKFDLVIGNPPYIGHKKIDNQYRKKIKNHYWDVYSDKADISFCFFKRGHELLKQQGSLMFITSRYFLESPSAKGLRSFLTYNFSIKKIIDFQGKNVFKGIGISPVIIQCNKGESFKNKTHIYKLEDGDRSKNEENTSIVGKNFKEFSMNQSSFSPKGWLLMEENKKLIYEKIHSLGDYYLNQVCSCHQGVITGCDKAFIVDESTIIEKGLEKSLLKPWIKNSQIQKFNNLDSRLYIIYTDSIEDLSLYPKVSNHISPYKPRLSRRRECARGVRHWYQLQWGRRLEVFSNPKIMFPFKAETNRFALVYEEILSSADVYTINVENTLSPVSLEYLAAFLNSKLFEFYFKAVGKKVGENQYDYYPNKIMNLRIKIGKNTKSIEGKVHELKSLYKELDIKKNSDKYNSTIIEKNITQATDSINEYFYELYELSKEEVGIIEGSIDNSLS